MTREQQVYELIPDLSDRFPEHVFVGFHGDEYLIIDDWGVSCETLLECDYPLDLIHGALGLPEPE